MTIPDNRWTPNPAYRIEPPVIDMPPIIDYGPPPVQPPKPKVPFWRSVPAIISGFVALFAIMLTLIHFAPDPKNDLRVIITSCEFSGTTIPMATVGLSVKNSANITQSATISIEYRDANGARLDTDTAHVRNIGAGDTARTEESTLLDAAPNQGSTCEITRVQ